MPSTPSTSHSSPSSSPPPTPPPTSTLPTPLSAPWETYTYTPTERHIFAPSPYKALLLPLWRFATPALALTSAREIYAYFLAFIAREDFVGADNARKFLQMGMTRSARYANHKGGRKYGKPGTKGARGDAGTKRVAGGKEGKGEGEKGGDDTGEKGGVGKEGEEEEEDWAGRQEKREAKEIFKRYWERAKGDGRYLAMKEEFVARRKEWEREQGMAADTGKGARGLKKRK